MLLNTPAFNTTELAECGFLTTFFIHSELNAIYVGLLENNVLHGQVLRNMLLNWIQEELFSNNPTQILFNSL